MFEALREFRRGIHRYVVYPAIVTLRGEAGLYRELRRLRRLQWCSRSELESRQRTRLAETLNHAYRHVPLYRERWDLSRPVEEGDVAEVVARLPFLSKSDLQERADDLASTRRPWRVSRKTTGGSTGEPVTVMKDRKAVGRERAATWLGYGWYGVGIGDRGARFWGSPSQLGKRRLRYAAADLAMNRIRFSAFSFGEQDLDEYWRTCLDVRPDYFYGYVSMMTEFARHLDQLGHDGRRLGLKAVITTSEALSAPQRDLLEGVFGAPVQNEYGCGELGPIAYECPEGSLHVISENVFVEVLTEDGLRAEPGESGEVVVTDLSNRAMPLVRYRVGDRAVRGDMCPCGRGFPTLERVWGRAYDFVRDGQGRRYHGEYFMYLFEDLRDRGAKIGKFRVTQRSEADLDVEVVAPSGLEPEHASFVEDRLERDMPGMRVTVRSVPAIERAPSGKTRVIRNPWLDGDGTD